jgi:hypothetical protein
MRRRKIAESTRREEQFKQRKPGTHERIAQASRKIGEHNQTFCDDAVTETDLFCLPRSENFGVSEQTNSNWLTKIEKARSVR